MRKQCTALFTSTIAGIETWELCANKYSAVFRITSPLRGLKPVTLQFKTEEFSFRITSPLRGLKLIDGRITVCTASLELSPHCGDIQKEPLGILLGGSFFVVD